MMNGDALLEQWLLDVRSLSLVTVGSANEHAHENMLVFPASELLEHSVSVRQISGFLVNAYGEYWKKAKALGVTGWFYAWHEEMSATLRCSMAAIESVAALPFRCRLSIADSPDVVSRELVESKYSQGIPAAELVPVESWDEYEQEPSGEYWLTVFARQIDAVSVAPLGR